MSAYYNENDSKTAAWLRELIKAGLIADGEVDERSIIDVQPGDVRGFTQCHFFAGIGGWSYALRLAGWPDDRSVWTGSCPCQPFSIAGSNLAAADSRHLWPVWLPLIKECRPPTLFGEQVSGTPGLSWLDLVGLELEDIDYAFAAADLPAASVNQLHLRRRLWWCASSGPDAECGGRQGLWDTGAQDRRRSTEAEWVASEFARLLSAALESAVPTGRFGALSNGVSGKVGRLRGYGNAIVPQVAAEFIGAYMDVTGGGT